MSQSSYPAEFREILRRIRAAATEANLEQALALADEAIAWGQRHGSRDAIDRGTVNRAGFSIASGRAEGLAKDLRIVLMRSRDPLNRCLAAYNLSLIYDRRSDFDKGLFYAKIALDQAHKSGDQEFIGYTHNQMSVILIATSYFDEALEHAQKALLLLPEETRVDRAMVYSNIGYCNLLTGRFSTGFSHLFTALRMLRRLGRTDIERSSCLRLMLCYGYIEIGRYDRAQRHGTAALAQAELAKETDIIKKSLYLLGEVAKQRGDSRAALRLFSRLQADHFPDNERLPDLLMQSETHRLVNLLA